MGIPSISPYSMPVEAELPANKVAWRPDPQRAVLLIHDMQNYFLKAYNTEESPVVELFSNISRLRSECEMLGIPVVYSAQLGGQSPEERGLLQDFWGPGIGAEPFQSQIAFEVAPGKQDLLMTKWRYSAFQKTDLLQFIQGHGRDQLIVCGIYAHIGCLLTSCEAFMQDIQPFFVADAVADFSLEKHRMALTYAAERCAVTLTTHRLITELNEASSSEQPILSANEESVQFSAEASGPLSIEQLRKQVARILQEEAEAIGAQDDLVALWGLDSIRIMSLAEKFSRCGLEITFAELAERPTLEAWWLLLSARMGPSIPNVDYFLVRKGV
ncbi:isochorismatase family protein [Paenibacillus bouchesdurhonensis]|uniref:isochorismatase family protein n=1 Tax=Paenibacillus bouchesdurhonensis TaxID=1870990 RepID=UPI000DA63FED|nr:isochorismatase family protein [Paenibacillus bouchesdurhonensis]